LPFYDLSSPKHYAVLALVSVDLISDALPFGKPWYLEVRHAIDYAKHCSRSHNAL
jgi:hypothetical protein